MENKSNTMLKSAMTWGLVLGVALVIFSLILYIVNILKPPFWVSLINYLVIIGGIVLGVKKYRDDDLGGEISYGKAFGFGVLICVFAALISAVYTYLLITVIDTEYMSKLMAITEEELLNKGLPEEQIDAAMAMSKKFTSPLFITISSVIGMGLIGAVFSAIVAIFMKKEKPIFDNPTDAKSE